MITTTPLVVKFSVKKLIYLIKKFSPSPNNLLESTAQIDFLYSHNLSYISFYRELQLVKGNYDSLKETFLFTQKRS